jgi:glycine cleavage system H protein
MAERYYERLRRLSGFRAAVFSRRQFLRSMGLIAGGAAAASIGLSASCSGEATTSTTTSTEPSTSPVTTTPTTMVQAQSTATNPPASSSPVSSTSPTSPPSVSPTQPASNPVTTYNYIPPVSMPPVLSVPGTDCTVATDRSYSDNHLWVKPLTSDNKIAVIGPTPTLGELVAYPDKLELDIAGTRLSIGDSFGTMEGSKLAADLTSPVSGTILQRNDFLVAYAEAGNELKITQEGFTAAWFEVVQLSNPAQLNSLLTPQQYLALLTSSK